MNESRWIFKWGRRPHPLCLLRYCTWSTGAASDLSSIHPTDYENHMLAGQLTHAVCHRGGTLAAEPCSRGQMTMSNRLVWIGGTRVRVFPRRVKADLLGIFHWCEVTAVVFSWAHCHKQKISPSSVSCSSRSTVINQRVRVRFMQTRDRFMEDLGLACGGFRTGDKQVGNYSYKTLKTEQIKQKYSNLLYDMQGHRRSMDIWADSGGPIFTGAHEYVILYIKLDRGPEIYSYTPDHKFIQTYIQRS